MKLLLIGFALIMNSNTSYSSCLTNEEFKYLWEILDQISELLDAREYGSHNKLKFISHDKHDDHQKRYSWQLPSLSIFQNDSSVSTSQKLSEQEHENNSFEKLSFESIHNNITSQSSSTPIESKTPTLPHTVINSPVPQLGLQNSTSFYEKPFGKFESTCDKGSFSIQKSYKHPYEFIKRLFLPSKQCQCLKSMLTHKMDKALLNPTFEKCKRQNYSSPHLSLQDNIPIVSQKIPMHLRSFYLTPHLSQLYSNINPSYYQFPTHFMKHANFQYGNLFSQITPLPPPPPPPMHWYSNKDSYASRVYHHNYNSPS